MQRLVSGTAWQDAVAYQVFVRSFRDGNGDRIGDFAGLVEQLDLLAGFGATALWLNPVFPSPSHHNYFPTDFFDTDPTYGSLEDFAALCRAVHDRSMRLLIDMETQYLSTSHRWYREAFRNPESSRGDWFFFRGPGNTQPVHLMLRMGPTADSAIRVSDVATLNLAHADVRAFQERVYAFWLDPVGLGERAGGVDGYRMDHVMDDLDDLGVLTDLYTSFWRPLVAAIRRQEPDLFFLAEPADWQSHGRDLLQKTGMDGAFALPLMRALRGFDKATILGAVGEMLDALVPGKLAFTLLENHDVSRFATAVGGEPGRLRVGAALLLTLPGVPTLYYGQELGMVGEVGVVLSDWHLPAREAFKWSADLDAPGMATWYRERQLWPHTRLREPEPAPFETQVADPGSLWHLYRRLIALRHAHVALRRGDFAELASDSEDVLAFVRRYRSEDEHEVVAVAVNLSAESRTVDLDPAPLAEAAMGRRVLLLGDSQGRLTEDAGKASRLELSPYEIRIVRFG